MKIEKLLIEKLIPYALNSRTHSDLQIAQIAASIREFGFTNPVLLDANGTIIAGHGRVLAARKLEMKEIPCIQFNHLTPTQVRAYVIADNKLALNAGWDESMLKVEIEALREEGFEESVIGFTEAEIASLFLEVQHGETDLQKEWEGMPEFEDDGPCHRKVVVNFDSDKDVVEFFAAIKQSYTDKTKSIWFPRKERRDLSSQEWISEASAPEGIQDNANSDPR